MHERTEAPARALLIDESDDVAVLLAAVEAGAMVRLIADGRETATLVAAASMPAGHKLARRALPAGALVRKYGEPIGRLTAPVAEGAHVHVHNLVSLRGGPDPETPGHDFNGKA